MWFEVDGVENVSVDLQSDQFVSISSYRNVGVRHLRKLFCVWSAFEHLVMMRDVSRLQASILVLDTSA
jgi:hypothetical protein